jgi:hypothetical protein
VTTAVKTEITDETVLSTLREVVAERPEYAYDAPEHMKDNPESPDCFYVHKDEDGDCVAPGCVIGMVLHRLGVPLEVLAENEGKTVIQVRHLMPDVSMEVRHTLNLMQSRQDVGKPWGMAYAMATGETI